jgi:hypothetical protein
MPLRDDNDKTDLWTFSDLGSEKAVTNQAFKRVLHASGTQTPRGHNLLYTCPPNNNDHAEEFSIDPVDSPDAFTFTGYFKLSSRRTNQRATFGLDITPAGRARVHQEPGGSDLYLY